MKLYLVALCSVVLGIGAPSSGGVAPPRCQPRQLPVIAVDRASHAPVAHARLETNGPRGSTFLGETTEAGTACVTAVGAGALVTVRHPAFEPGQARMGRLVNEGTEPLTIELTPLASVSLAVRAADRPLPGAQVVWRAGKEGAGKGTTDPQGNWSGQVGAWKQRAEIEVAADGFGSVCRAVASLDPGVNRLDVSLLPPGAVTVAVRDEVGEPVEKAELRWLPEIPQGGCRSAASAGVAASQSADAVSKLGQVAPGTGLLEISAPGYALRRLGPVPVRSGQVTDLGTVALELRRVARGSVKSRSGKALAGVPVAVLRSASNAVLAETTSDRAGNYEVELPAHGAFLLRAGRRPGPVCERDDIPQGAGAVDLVVPDAAGIAGSIRTATGEPLGEAAVTASRIEAGRGARAGLSVAATSDETGRYAFEGLEAGRWRLDVRLRGYAPTVKAPIDLCEAEKKEVNLRLDRGRQLRGRVIDAETEKPVAGASVRAEGSSEDEWATTDPQGRFELGGAASGMIRIAATHPTAGRGRVTTDAASGPVEIRLAQGGDVEGTVRDGEGLPLPDKTVEIQGLGLSGITDGLGRYRITDVPPGIQRVVLRRNLPGDHRLLSARDAEVKSGQATEVDFDDGATVSGKVTWNDSPMRDALITITRMNEGRPSGNLTDTLATTRTDEAGDYRIGGLRPGPYTVSARGDVNAIYRSTDITSEGENRVDLVAGGTDVVGTVRDAETARPIPGVKVVAFDPARSFGLLVNGWANDDDLVETAQLLDIAWAAYTARDGQFRLLLPEGRFQLEVGAVGYETARRDIESVPRRTEAVEILLEPSWELLGTVTDAWRNPVAGCGVTAFCGEGRISNVFADARGIFRFEGLRPSPCALLAFFPGYGAGLLEALPTKDGGFLEISIRPPGSLRLGLPASIPGDSPVLLTPGGRNLRELLKRSGFGAVRPVLSGSDEGEQVLFPVLPPGSYLVAAPGLFEPKAVQVVEGNETVLDLRER